MPSHEREVYAFGEFELDLAARALTKSGIPVSLAPKTFDLLAMLVRRPGILFSKREIIEELWPDTFVEEANLSFQVAALRKALGESANRWIETVPKHGYRFQASVEPLTTKGPLAVAGGQRTRWRRVLVATFVVLALLLAGWLVVLRYRHSPEALLIALPVTTYPGYEAEPSLSPDGSQVAFAWDGPKHDNLDVYLKVIGEEPPWRLTSDARPEYCPSWSPDGRYIAYSREGEIVIVPALGGPERVVVRASADWLPNSPDSCVSWFPDGSALAVVGYPLRTAASIREKADARPNGLAYPMGPYAIDGVSLATGHSWQLTFPADRTLGDGQPRISPDGRQLAFLRSDTVDFDQPQLLSVPLSSDKLPVGEPVRLGADILFGKSSGPRELIGTGLAWLPDSRTVLCAQRGRLWSVSIPSGTPKLLPLSGFPSAVGGALYFSLR